MYAGYMYHPTQTVINTDSVGPVCEELFLPYWEDFNLLLLGVLLLGGKMRFGFCGCTYIECR